MGRKGLLQRRKMVDPPCEKNRWVSGVGEGVKKMIKINKTICIVQCNA